MAIGGTTSEDVEARVSQVCDIMSAGQWVTHITAKNLAKEWGVSVDTVNRVAGEASRRIRFLLTSAPESRARLFANLEAIVSMSLQKSRSRDAIEAIKVMSGIVDASEKAELEEKTRGGGDKPKRVEVVFVTHPDAPTAEPAEPEPAE